MEHIHSENNTRIKEVRSLLQYSKRRRKEERFVLEGLRLISDAIQAGARAEYILFSEDALENNSQAQALHKNLYEQGVSLASVENSLFQGLSETEHSQGILGLFPFPKHDIPPHPGTILVLDRIADPGNLGTIIRSAVATGADAVISTPGSVDLYNPKVVRAAMGGHFKIALHQWTWDDILALQLPIILAEANSPTSIYESDLQTPAIIVIGAEAHGFSLASRAHADSMVSIPMQQGESLNAAMAATVILYEILRQRYHA